LNAVFHLKGNELDERFVEAVKAAFKDKEIEITVCERDETAYLLRSPANRERLLRAVSDVEKLHNTVVVDHQV